MFLETTVTSLYILYWNNTLLDMNEEGKQRGDGKWQREGGVGINNRIQNVPCQQIQEMQKTICRDK